LQAIAGLDPNDPTSRPDPVPDMLAGVGKGVLGLRIGWDETYATQDMAPDFAQAVVEGVRVMERLGAAIVPVSMPARLLEYLAAWPVLCTSEALDAHREHYPSQAEVYGPWFRGWLERGAGVSGADYARANALRAACVGELRVMMQGIDLLACPSTSQAAYPFTPEQAYGPLPPDRDPWQSRFTVPMDFAGLPTLSLPCGLSEAGLPLSLQFVGHALSEPLLVQAGEAYESATEWHKLHPPEWWSER
jgi:amidase